MRKIILASASSHRRDILKKFGFPFTVERSDYPEDLSLRLRPRDLAIHLARKKAEVVAARHKGALVIGADTLVVFGKKIIGKPKDLRDAARILKGFSGKKHSLVTGICIIDAKSGRTVTNASRTDVYFRKLTDGEIRAYVKTREPMGKAGAYGIQDRGGLLVEKIRGDFYTVVGLPAALLAKELKRFGL